MPAETAPVMPSELAGISANNFGVTRLQVSAFTPDEEVSSAKLSRILLPAWEKWFDGEQFLMPMPAPLPREVPRVILQSKDSSRRCEISAERISIVWQKTEQGASMPTVFVPQAVELLNDYVGKLGARVGRLAAVMTRFAPHAKPGPFLAQHFCQARWLEKPFNRPENFELHAHKVFTLAGAFTVNSWVRNKTAFASGPTATIPGIAVEQDLNTLHEQASEKQFLPAELGSFFGSAQVEFDVILNLYYPMKGTP